MDPPVVSTATHWGKSGVYKLRTGQGPAAEQIHPSFPEPTSPASPLAAPLLERFSNQRAPHACPSEPWTSTTPYSPQNNNFKATWFLAPTAHRDDGSQRRNQNHMNVIFSKIHRIPASGLGPGGCVFGPEPGLGGPQRGLGSPASPPRPRLPRTPSVLSLLAEASTSNTASADISVFYGVFISSFMVQLKIAQLLFESCPNMHKHQQNTRPLMTE